MLIFDQIGRDVAEQVRDKCRKGTRYEDVRLCILVGTDTLYAAMGECQGRVPEIAMEVYNNRTIRGFRLYRVIDDFEGWRIVEAPEK